MADLFHLPALEEAVVGFLVEHLSELRHSRQDEALQLPYRLLREVLKSDRLTSLSEEEIWKVASLCFTQLSMYQGHNHVSQMQFVLKVFIPFDLFTFTVGCFTGVDQH